MENGRAVIPSPRCIYKVSFSNAEPANAAEPGLSPPLHPVLISSPTKKQIQSDNRLLDGNLNALTSISSLSLSTSFIAAELKSSLDADSAHPLTSPALKRMHDIDLILGQYHQRGIVDRDVLYVTSMSWYKSWRDNAVDKSPVIPIDNWDIIDLRGSPKTDEFSYNCTFHLREGLKEGVNYKLLPSAAWEVRTFYFY